MGQADPLVPSSGVSGNAAGIVHLTGTVATDDERTSIERIARDTPGVCAVDNYVRFGDVPVRVKPTNP